MIAEDQRTPSAMSNLQEMIRRFQDLCGIPISEALTGTAPRALDWRPLVRFGMPRSEPEDCGASV